MIEHLVPVCHATSMPIGGSSKLGSRTTLIHAHSTTPEIVAPSLCSVAHHESVINGKAGIHLGKCSSLLPEVIYSITATASISMRSLGSMRAETSTIEDAG